MVINQDETLDLLKELSTQDFLDVGLNQVAYIRRVEALQDEQLKEGADKVYAVYAADGSQISLMDSYETAVNAIRINDLFPVTLH